MLCKGVKSRLTDFILFIPLAFTKSSFLKKKKKKKKWSFIFF